MEKKPVPEAKDSSPAPKIPKEKKKSACLTLFGGCLLGLFLLFFFGLIAVSLAVAATGLVEVPVLSKIMKPPLLEEDFSYRKVSQSKLDAKLKSLEKQPGLISVTLTDDELNTILSQPGPAGQEESALKSILVKFTPGIIKITGVLNQNEAPFYLELHIVKTKDNFEFSFSRARLGALPIPSGILTLFVGNFIGLDIAPFQDPKPESFLAQEVVVGEGTLKVAKLDLGRFFGPPEE